MIELEELRADRGDSIPAKVRLMYRYLEEQIQRFEKMTGPGLLRDTTPNGFYFRAVPSGDGSFSGALRVSVSGLAVSIGAGAVDDQTPTIGGEPVTGDDEKKIPAPKFTIEGGPGEGLRSWVCVEAHYENKALREEEPLPVVHRVSLDLDESEAGRVGVLPLALLQWADAATVSRVWQIVYFDQRTVVRAGGRGQKDRIVFYPAS